MEPSGSLGTCCPARRGEAGEPVGQLRSRVVFQVLWRPGVTGSDVSAEVGHRGGPPCLPGRLTTKVLIVNSGWSKRHVDDDTAAALHGMAATAYPFLRSMRPRRFVRLVCAGELVLGTALLLPVIPAVVAGAALTGFSAGLLIHGPRCGAGRAPTRMRRWVDLNGTWLGRAHQGFLDLVLELLGRRAGSLPHGDEVADAFDAGEVADHPLGFLPLIVPVQLAALPGVTR